MRNIQRYIAVFLLCFAAKLYAQQLPYYTQFRNYQSIINPGSVNSEFFLYEYNVSLQANYRAQWIAQDETPRTMHLSGEYISNFGGAFELLAGAMVLQDRTGPQSLTGTYARIGSIFAKDPYKGAFSLGFSFGSVQYRIAADRLVWKDPDDPNIPDNNISVSRPDIGVGLFYYRRLKNGFFTEDNIYIGLSVPQVLGTETMVQTPDDSVSISRVPHIFGTAGWYHFINEDAFFEVSGWLKYVAGARLNLDLMGRFQPTRTFWVGGGFNLNGIVHLEAGLNVPGFVFDDANLKIGYAFDYNISAFDIPFGTSHEITLAYMFDTYRRR